MIRSIDIKNADANGWVPVSGSIKFPLGLSGIVVSTGEAESYPKKVKKSPWELFRESQKEVRRLRGKVRELEGELKKSLWWGDVVRPFDWTVKMGPVRGDGPLYKN